MKHQLLVIALVCLASLPVHSAEAGCDFSFNEVRQDNQRPYSMFSDGVSVIELTVSVESGDCPRLNFTFESQNSSTLVGRDGPIPYQLKGRSGRNIEVNGISAIPEQELITSRQNQTLVVRAFVVPGSFAGPGRYTDQISLKASDGSSTIEEIELPLAIQVSPEANIALTGQASNGYSAKGGGGLNFGELKPGKERSAFLFVRSNVSYALNISSENRGVLAHQQETGDHARIPYSAWLDQERLSLTTPTTVQTAGMTPVYRSRPHKLSARIEPFRNKLAGEYRDVILVEVVFLE